MRGSPDDHEDLDDHDDHDDQDDLDDHDDHDEGSWYQFQDPLLRRMRGSCLPSKTSRSKPASILPKSLLPKAANSYFSNLQFKVDGLIIIQHIGLDGQTETFTPIDVTGLFFIIYTNY